MDRQSAGSQDSVTDRSGGRQLSFSSTLGPRSSRGKSAGFFPFHRRRTASFIDLTAQRHCSVRRRVRVTKNQPIHQFLESRNQRSSDSTQRASTH